MNWQDRQVNYEAKCVEILQRISPSKTNYEAQQKYHNLIEQIDKRSRTSGHTSPRDNIMSIILEEIENLNK